MPHNYKKGDVVKIVKNGDGAKHIHHELFIGCEVRILEVKENDLHVKRTGKWLKGIFSLTQIVESGHVQMVKAALIELPVPNEFADDDFASEILLHQ